MVTRDVSHVFVVLMMRHPVVNTATRTEKDKKSNFIRMVRGGFFDFNLGREENESFYSDRFKSCSVGIFIMTVPFLSNVVQKCFYDDLLRPHTSIGRRVKRT